MVTTTRGRYTWATKSSGGRFGQEAETDARAGGADGTGFARLRSRGAWPAKSSARPRGNETTRLRAHGELHEFARQSLVRLKRAQRLGFQSSSTTPALRPA